jgi:hypothetical protein
VLAQEIQQCDAKLILGETARTVVARYAAGREQLSTGFVLIKILFRSREADGQRDDDERS